MKKLLIVDGNSILNRAYYGIRPLSAPDGTPTNAVYGFLNILFKYMDEESFDYLAVAFDVKEKTFRHKMFAEYKAQRKPAPEDFIRQLPIIKEVLSAMNIACIEKPGYEADDIIGTVSAFCDREGVECRILTGDKDDLQLATKNVKISLVITRMGQTTTTLFDEDGVMEKYGVTPKEFIDVKGLMGDSSDNIPGVKGIGEKTAFSIIGEYKSIENIYANIENINATPSVKKKLEEGKEDAYLSKILATIDVSVPIDLDFKTFEIKEYNNDALSQLFARLNFKSFMEKLNLKAEVKTETMPEYEKTGIDSAEMIEKIKLSKDFTYGLSEKYFAVLTDGKMFYTENPSNELLKVFFEDETIRKTAHDIKSDILRLNKLGVEFKGEYFDTLIAAYIQAPEKSAYDVEDLALQYLGLSLSKEDKEAEVQLSFDFGDEEKSDDSFFDEIYATFMLKSVLKKKAEENRQMYLLEKIEFPLVKVLADMETEGVFVDKNALLEFGDFLTKRISELERMIYSLSGREFNINSPKQLGEVLFEDLKLPHGKKTKTGYSTGIDVLKKLESDHEIVRFIMEYRHLTKLKSTYVEGLSTVICTETGRIHSSFNQTVTTTGRISSTEPNLQNIPVRTEIGREIRRMFIAPEGKVLIDADYSQIELRVLAHVSDDKNMIDAFNSDADIHSKTASMVFNLPLDRVTSVERSRAKAVNFGIVYGIGEFSLSQDLKVPMKVAKEYIDGYFRTYPKIKSFMDETISLGREKGYVKTMFERRRYLPELKASNKNIQAFGERMAMNAPIQGTAADIIKIAMVNVYNKLKENNFKSKLILQVHDELIIEAPLDEEEKVKNILKCEMENAIALSVPLKVDMNTGKSWYDTK